MRRVPCLQCRSLPADGSGLSNKPQVGPDEDQPQGPAQARGATAVPLPGTCWQHLLGHHGQAVREELVISSGLTHRKETTPSLPDHPCMATKDVPSRASGPLSRHKGQGVARGRWWAWVLSRTRSTHPLLHTGWETESRPPPLRSTHSSAGNEDSGEARWGRRRRKKRNLPGSAPRHFD